MTYLPIRKVAVGALASGAAYVAKRLGLDLGPAELNDLVEPVVGLAAAYLVKDPRVKDAIESAEDFIADHPEAAQQLHDLADRFLAEREKTDAAVAAHYAAAANLDVSRTEAVRKVAGK